MKARIGDFVTGFGDLYRISDVWRGDISNDAEVMLENISSDHWAFQWISQKDLDRHFEEVGML